jgi:hypothetical protein
MQKFNFYEYSYSKDSEIYQNLSINYSEKINKLLNYINNYNIKDKINEKEKDIYLAISLISGVFFGDAYGSYFCDKSNKKSDDKFNKDKDLLWQYNPYFGTSKYQITDSSEMCLSLAYGLIDSFEFDENLIAFFYHYWYYSPGFNIEKTSNNAFNLFRSEMKIFNNYIKKQKNLNLSEICINNGKKYNDNSLSNGFLIRHSPYFIDFFFRNKNKILEFSNGIIFSNCEFSMEKLFKFTYTYTNKEVILSHSFSENTFAASLYDYILSLIFSFSYFPQEKIFNLYNTNKDQKNTIDEYDNENYIINNNDNNKPNNLELIPLTKFEKICEIIIHQIKNLLNCEFIKLYHTEKKLVDRINKLGILIKKYSLEDIINRVQFTTNEADNDTENYTCSIELLIIILYNANKFIGNDVYNQDIISKEKNKEEKEYIINNNYTYISNNDNNDNQQIETDIDSKSKILSYNTNKNKNNDNNDNNIKKNTSRYSKENLKHNTFRNILNFISKNGGNNTNRNCAIVGGVFSSILGYGNIDKEVFDVFSFMPFMGYSTIENKKFNLKILKNDNLNSKSMIKYRPFMFSPGIILIWVIYHKAKIDGDLDLEKYFLIFFIYFFNIFFIFFNFFYIFF